MTQIFNAAPMTIFNGIKDSSFRQAPIARAIRPQHMPLFYIKAASGPVGRTIFDPNQGSITRLFGDRTFDVADKYFNHQTAFLQGAIGEGNKVVVERVVAADAGDVAHVVLYLDVLETKVPVYEKEIDGSIKYDENGEPIAAKASDGKDKMVDGYEVMWVSDFTKYKAGEYQQGLATVREGVQVGTNGNSKQYPIYEVPWDYVGEDGNNHSISISALTERDRGLFPSTVLTEGKTYPYLFKLNRLTDPVTGRIDPIVNSLGSETMIFVAPTDARDPRTKELIGFEKRINKFYVKTQPEVKTGLSEVYFYETNYKELVKNFYEAEAEVVDEHSDWVIDKDAKDYDVINIANFVNSNNSPYNALKLVDSVESVRLTHNTKIYLGGGDDGDLSDKEFEAYVRADMENFGNPLKPYVSFDMYPETDFYDTGFTLETKLKLFNFISLRKDTFLVLSTHIHGEKLTLEDELAIGVALDTAGSLFPESTIYNTESTRALIYLGSGVISGSTYTERVPFTYGILVKAAGYMGAGNGKWVNRRIFDKAPGSVVRELEDVNIQWVPGSVRNTLWNSNINFPLKYTERHAYMPGIKTIYSDDTSILTSYFNVKAACHLERIGYDAWKDFSGNIELTDAQLIERVNEFIIERAQEAFDNLYVIVPETKITSRDELNGFSWTQIIHLYGNNMKTVMDLTIETHRFSDYMEGR